MTRSDSTTAPVGRPCDWVQELPKPTENTTCEFFGDQTNRLPSAAAATVPPSLMPPGSLPWNQFAPPSVENATWLSLGRSASVKLPARTITAGLVSAKSRLVVLVKLGEPNIFAGTLVRSSWRNPPMSPSALTSGAPVGGLIRSSTAVSSSPATVGRIVIWPPVSQLVRLVVP